MSERLTITVPGTPDARLSPNGRSHWGTKSKLVKQLRGDAMNAAYGAIGAGRTEPVFSGPIRVAVEIGWEPRRKRVDQDNAVGLTKAILDGFTDALVWVDDRYCILETFRQVRDPEKRGYVKVTMWQELAAEEQAA